MLSASFLLCLLGFADTTDLAHQVQIHLSAVGQPWLVTNGRALKGALPSGSLPVTFEVELNRRGGLTRVRSSLDSGNAAIDRLARDLFRAVPPLSTPPAQLAKAKRNIPCVVRLLLTGSPRGLDVGVVCQVRRKAQVAWKGDDGPEDASAHLFQGWIFETRGDLLKSTSAFRKAVRTAPDWPLAAMATGLSLARNGQLDEAKPLLEQWAAARKPTREIKRYLAGKGPPAGGFEEEEAIEDEDEPVISACERDEREISYFVRRRLRKLNRCVAAEQKRSPQAEMPEALPISFVVAPKGAVKKVALHHRYYKGGKLGKCVAKALNGRLEARGGSMCPAQFDIELGGGGL